jgi:hypothetical protein
MRPPLVKRSAAALPLLALFVSASSLSGCDEQPDFSPPPVEGPEPEPASQPRRYVVPFIGSGGFGFRHGSSFVGASARIRAGRGAR